MTLNYFPGTDENLEFESKLIELNIKFEKSFNDLPEEEKELFMNVENE